VYTEQYETVYTTIVVKTYCSAVVDYTNHNNIQITLETGLTSLVTALLLKFIIIIII